MTNEQLAHSLRAGYFTEDGQGCLETYDRRPWLDIESPKNENGTLFAVMYYYAFDKLGVLTEQDRSNFIHMIDTCASPESGVYYRRKQDIERSQSHDNLISLAAGSLLFNTHHAKDIADALDRNLWIWQKTLIQGGDVAFVHMCAGEKPHWWLMLWLLGGLYLTKKDAGQLNLARLRIWVLEKASKKYGFYKFPYQKWFNIAYPNNEYSTGAYFIRDTERNPYIDLIAECAKLKV